jgi:hypothetical protein
LVIKGYENDKRPKSEIYRRLDMRRMQKINTKIEMEARKMIVIPLIKGFLRQKTLLKFVSRRRGRINSQSPRFQNG